MHSVSTQKLAGMLRILVIAALACNLILLYLVPAAVVSGNGSLLQGTAAYLHSIFRPAPDDIVMAGAAASLLLWFWVWQDAQLALQVLFLTISGLCTAAILRQALRVLDTVSRQAPFSMENAVSLRRAAVYSFVVAAAALVRIPFCPYLFQGASRVALYYNGLFVLFFSMVGLLALVMSALFRQAAELQADSDLTI